MILNLDIMNTIEKYISLAALAAKTKLSPKFLNELAEARKIPFLQIGKQKRFKPSSVQSALDDMAAGKQGASNEQA